MRAPCAVLWSLGRSERPPIVLSASDGWRPELGGVADSHDQASFAESLNWGRPRMKAAGSRIPRRNQRVDRDGSLAPQARREHRGLRGRVGGDASLCRHSNCRIGTLGESAAGNTAVTGLGSVSRPRFEFCAPELGWPLSQTCPATATNTKRPAAAPDLPVAHPDRNGLDMGSKTPKKAP